MSVAGSPGFAVPDGHRTAERRSLAMHQVIADQLTEPQLAHARERVGRWLHDGSVDPHWAGAWAALLSAPLERVAAELRRDDTIVVVWEDRLVTVQNANTRGAAGLCLEPHHAVAAKLAAGREHDVAFATTALQAGLVDEVTLRERIAALPVDEASRQHADALLTLAASRSQR